MRNLYPEEKSKQITTKSLRLLLWENNPQSASKVEEKKKNLCLENTDLEIAPIKLVQKQEVIKYVG